MKHVVPQAIHDSEARLRAPKCRPGTRLKELSAIRKWPTSTKKFWSKREKKFLWVSGEEQCGKSAVLGTLADEYHGEGSLAAGFFFSQNCALTKTNLLATLVYQIAHHPNIPPGIKSLIASSFKKNPLVFTKEFSLQLETLLFGPVKLHYRTTGSPTWPKYIVIDALDECALPIPGESFPETSTPAARDNQVAILRSLIDRALDDTFPFRFIISTRPHDLIAKVFAKKSTAAITTTLVLAPIEINWEDTRSILSHEYAPSVLSMSMDSHEIHRNGRDISMQRE